MSVRRLPKAALGLAAAAPALTLPILLGPYWTNLLNDVGIYAILGLSLNIILGHCGLFHMGHSAFYAVGAYTAAILSTRFGWPILWAMPFSGLLAALFALAVAKPIIHLRGDYLLVVTIGIVEIVRIALVNNIFGLTGGSNGLLIVDPIRIFGLDLFRPIHFYYLIWSMAAITVVLFYLLQNSRFGRALNYIKQDELAAEGSGIDTTRYKLAAFVLGALWAGMIGAIFAAKIETVSPQSFAYSESVLCFAIVILGGAGSIPGVLLGAFLITGLPEVFRGLQSYRLFFFGAAMVVMMIFRPQGLIPPRRRRYDVRPYLGRFPCGIAAHYAVHAVQGDADGGMGPPGDGEREEYSLKKREES
ncbi:MAG: branched-chain amino acid ABC transporter permease [Deltaproteobacteria bacterium]|jgi:branched-chain amino acid transport system permease protein|nr:branched-chain amino acid ABC transporter permease [Deltaproteobacteria bacterium]